MRTYTLTDAEADLRDALTIGDPDMIDRCGAAVDKLDVHPDPASTLAVALWYAEVCGLKVFPCQPGLKVPHPGTHGCKDATTDPDTIRAWWDRWPGSNVAIATGHLIDVVDIDGLVGQVSRCADWSVFKQLQVLATVSTPRPGGMHLYVPATEMGNKAALTPGVDYRGRSGYVLAAPSSTPQGTYRFLTPLDPATLGAVTA